MEALIGGVWADLDGLAMSELANNQGHSAARLFIYENDVYRSALSYSDMGRSYADIEKYLLHNM
ncbi:hypothetical protein [Paraburkholderia haematera]|uniref:hypothetical protein n=1 Tax=Paraburkholderia haematera TaxID=2793077 RepID=UPI001B8AA0BD|nr:hypothetical protein [Paraburkholderia haematera]